VLDELRPRDPRQSEIDQERIELGAFAQENDGGFGGRSFGYVCDRAQGATERASHEGFVVDDENVGA